MDVKNNLEIGKLGEYMALKYLQEQLNWGIILKNYRRKSDEIDIIAKSTDGTLVFVEVKSLIRQCLSTLNTLMPEDNLTAEKRRKIARTCAFFARKYPELVDEEKGWRMDLLAIDFGVDGQVKEIRYYENI